MKILLAVDESQHIQKALEFIPANKTLLADDELAVSNVQRAIPGGVTATLGSAAVGSHHAEKANNVLKPIRNSLDGQAMRYNCYSVTGAVVGEMIFAAEKAHARMIVRGTCRHCLVGRALTDSVAQRLLFERAIPARLIR